MILILAYHNLINNIQCVYHYDAFEQALNNKQLCMINWCDDSLCEQQIKDTYHAKSLCIPEEIFGLKDEPCICGNSSKHKVLFGKSY
jgi:hypothetical protein